MLWQGRTAGFLNLYARNHASARAEFWSCLVDHFPMQSSGVLEGISTCLRIPQTEWGVVSLQCMEPSWLPGRGYVRLSGGKSHYNAWSQVGCLGEVM